MPVGRGGGGHDFFVSTASSHRHFVLFPILLAYRETKMSAPRTQQSTSMISQKIRGL